MSEVRLIDASALLEAFSNSDHIKETTSGLDVMEMLAIKEIIDNAPTVPLPDFKEGYKQAILDGKTNYSRPEGEWIPVTERLPYDRDWYLGVFREPDTGFIGLPYICDYIGVVTKGTTKEGWILRGFTDIDNADDYIKSLECVAWQSLPEPYKEET